MKKLIKYYFNKFGYELHNISKEIENHTQNKWTFLKGMDIKTILDIGANKGQFAEEVYNIFPETKIYSFEPLEDSYKSLTEKFLNNNRIFTYNIALGEQDEKKTFYISSGSPSSSLLNMGKLHKKLFPHTASIIEQQVTVEKLDNVKGIEILDNLLIKIDVQGAEDKVIRGGIQTFKKAKVIITEVNYAVLYENQPLFKEIFTLLDGLNFRYIGNLEQYYHPVNNAPLFGDAIFINEEFYNLIFN